MRFLLVTFLLLAGNAFGAWVDSCGKNYSAGGISVGNGLDPHAAKAAVIFKRTCVSCHNPNNLSGNVDMLDVDQMWEKSLVLQGGTNSKLYKSLNRPTGWMPLGGEILSVGEKNDILLWQEKNGGKKPPPLVDDSPPVGLPYVAYDDLVKCIFIDIFKVNEVDREFTRYLELSNLSNNKKEIEFRRQQEAVIKALNSISNQPPLKFEGIAVTDGRRAKAGIVDEYGIILRFDVRDIGINDAKFYDEQVLVVGKYPYALDRDDFELGEEVEAFEDAIAAETNSDLAFIRGDFFVHDAFQPPIYHNFLDNVGLSAETKDDLLKLLGVDQTEQFDDEEAKRSGIRFSQVATFSRVVDHFQVDAGFPFQFQGQLVTSYDFNDNGAVIPETNIFGFPFGPAGLFDGLLVTAKEFIHQAEEWIYTNGANGTSIYAIFNGDGVRQEVVPLDIASDPLNVTISPDFGIISPNNNKGEIVNGLSCAGCHSSGMILYKDILKDHIQFTPAGFTSEEVLFAKDNFFEQSELRKTLFDYVTIFQKAQNVVGVSNQVAQNTEQIYRSAQYYQGLVDICELSAELLLDCEEGKKRMARDPALAIELGYGPNIDGFATRNTVEAEFGRIAESFFVGKQILFDGEAPKCVLKANKKVVFQGDIVRFVIQVIGEADIVKINGKKVKNFIDLRLNKLGLNRIVGDVANEFGAFQCFAEVKVKKKFVKPPTCSITSDKNDYWLNDYANAQIKYTGNPTTVLINGASSPSGKVRILLSKLGRFRLFGFVKNGGGKATCERYVNVKKKVVIPPCYVQISNHTHYKARFDLRDKKTGERLFKHLKTLDGKKRFRRKLDNHFDFLGQLYSPNGGYYYNKIWPLKRCKAFKIVMRHGRQILVKDH